MNRIRKYKSGYQALTTPHQRYNTGFEFVLGSWTDEGLTGFKVYTYDNYYDAECRVGDSPDINWDQLIDFHKDQFPFFRDIIQKVINYAKMAVEFHSHLMTPNEAKDKDPLVAAKTTLKTSWSPSPSERSQKDDPIFVST